MLRLLSLSKGWFLRLQPPMVGAEGETLELLDEPAVPTPAIQDKHCTTL